MSANGAGKHPEPPTGTKNLDGHRAFHNAGQHLSGNRRAVALNHQSLLPQTAASLSTLPVNQNGQASTDISGGEVYTRSLSNLSLNVNSQGFGGGTHHTQDSGSFRGAQNRGFLSVTNSETTGLRQQIFNYRPSHSSSSDNGKSLSATFQPQWQELHPSGSTAHGSQDRDESSDGPNNYASSSRTAVPHPTGPINSPHVQHDGPRNVIRHPRPVRRIQKHLNWGLKCPLRPPTPSEGAAQKYSRYGVQENQRTIVHDNGTCLSFAPEDLIDEIDFETEPFIDQMLEIDTAVRNIQAERDLRPSAPEDPFNNFRDGRRVPLDLMSVISLPGGHSRLQVPSMLATVLAAPSTYTRVSSRAAQEAAADTRYGTTGGPPLGSVPKYGQHRCQETGTSGQVKASGQQGEHPNPQFNRPRRNEQNRKNQVGGGNDIDVNYQRGGSASMNQSNMHRGPLSGPMQSQLDNGCPRNHNSHFGRRRGGCRGHSQASLSRPENSRDRRTRRRSDERKVIAYLARCLTAGETLPRVPSVIDDGVDEAEEIGQVDSITPDIRSRPQFVGQGYGAMQVPLRIHHDSIGKQQHLGQFHGNLGYSRGIIPLAGSYSPIVGHNYGYQNWQEELHRAGLMPTNHAYAPNGDFTRSESGSGSDFGSNRMHMHMNVSPRAFQPAPQQGSTGGGLSYPVIGMVAPPTVFNNGFQAPSTYQEAYRPRTGPATASMNSAYIDGVIYGGPLPFGNMGHTAAFMSSDQAYGSESSSRRLPADGAPVMNSVRHSALERFGEFAHEPAPETNDFFGQATLEEDDGFDYGGYSSLQEYADFQSTRLAAEQQREEAASNQGPRRACAPNSGISFHVHAPSRDVPRANSPLLNGLLQVVNHASGRTPRNLSLNDPTRLATSPNASIASSSTLGGNNRTTSSSPLAVLRVSNAIPGL